MAVLYIGKSTLHTLSLETWYTYSCTGSTLDFLGDNKKSATILCKTRKETSLKAFFNWSFLFLLFSIILLLLHTVQQILKIRYTNLKEFSFRKAVQISTVSSQRKVSDNFSVISTLTRANCSFCSKRPTVWQSIFLSVVGRRPGHFQKAMKHSTSAQGQPLSCGFICNVIAWLPVTDYHLASHILTDAYLLSHKRQLPEHLYTLAPSDSSISLSIWQLIFCPQPPHPRPNSQKMSRLCPGPVMKK